MTMKTKTKRILCSALCLALLPSAAVLAKSDAPTLVIAPVSDGLKSVKVSVAPYNTIINGNAWDTKNARYPILTYKDVTYMPMTYDLCSELGLCIGYSQDEGLAVIREETPQYAPWAYPEGYAPFGDWYPNDLEAKYDALTVGYPVRIEGERVNARNTQYPLLNFRDITYFPMIWDYTRKLCFETKWDTGTFTLNQANGNNSLYLNGVENGSVLTFTDCVETYGEYFDGEGNVVFGLTDRYYDFYHADMELATLEKFRSSFDAGDAYGLLSTCGSIPYTDITDRLTVENGEILLDGVSVIKPESKYIFAPSAGLYRISDKASLVLIDMYTNENPAPYTSRCEYLLGDFGNGYTRITEWSDKYNCDKVLLGKDGAYVCTNCISPLNMARWSNDAGAILYIDAASGKVTNLASLYQDFNSLAAYGMKDGKLYVKAMYCPNMMQLGGFYPQISVLNDGYYTIADGSFELTKLYPYVRGEVGMTESGCFYLVPTYEFDPCVIDLLTGRSLTLDDHFSKNY